MKKVVIYTAEGCPYCTSAKEYLEEKGVAFEEKNTKEKDNRKELMALGFMSVPVILVDNETVVGFDQEKLESLLGL